MINNDYSSPWSPLFYFVNRYSNPQDLVAVLTARQQTVERFMQTVRWTESDIDLFVYGLESEAAANRKVMALLAKITKNAKAAGAQDVVYIKTPNTITLDAGRRFRKVQIITRLYSAKADVLNTFDIDCCGFGYDGSDCWFVNRAGVAMNQKVNIVDLTLRGAAYEHRLTKYATRGFAVGVPGLDKSDIIDANYFKVKSEANSWGGTSFVGDGWSWNKWQECTGTLERLLLNEAIGKSEGYLDNPFPGRLRKEVFPADKVKQNILITPTGHDIDQYPLQRGGTETIFPATLRFLDFFPPLSQAPAAGGKKVCIKWGKGVMPRQPVSWAEWTKGVLKSGSKKPAPRDYDWAKQAEERRRKEEAEKAEAEKLKAQLIADTKAAMEAAKREQKAKQAQEKKADEATRELLQARERCEALSLLAAEAEAARQRAELLAKQAGADNDNEEGLCVVCLDAAADYAFIPCGHRCVCKADAEMIQQSARACPICRQMPENFHKIYAA